MQQPSVDLGLVVKETRLFIKRAKKEISGVKLRFLLLPAPRGPRGSVFWRVLKGIETLGREREQGPAWCLSIMESVTGTGTGACPSV